MTATIEAQRSGGLYMLRMPFDGTVKSEAAWYERMSSDRDMSFRLNGRIVAGHLVTVWPFPVEKCIRLAFRPDERQETPVNGAPVEKAQPMHRTVHALVGNTWYSIDLPAPTPKTADDFDKALYRALHS